MPKPQRIQKPLPKWGHKGDTFREILDEWERMGLAQLEASSDRFVWWGKREVLLHDHPRIEDDLPEFNVGLFGNAQHEKGLPWIFWGRNPELLENYHYTLTQRSVRERTIKSIFLGKVENQIQFNNRFQSKVDWSNHIDLYCVVSGVNTPYPCSQEEYLKFMADSKFALLLPGYGPKCNRDIEAIAMGAIPIVTPGVCTEYYNTWEEGKNYLRMETVEDLERIYDTPNDQLQEMQETNYQWYVDNCTTFSSFYLTKKIIEETSEYGE